MHLKPTFISEFFFKQVNTYIRKATVSWKLALKQTACISSLYLKNDAEEFTCISKERFQYDRLCSTVNHDYALISKSDGSVGIIASGKYFHLVN